MTKKICLVILIVIFIYLILNMKNNIENFSNKKELFFIHIPKNAGTTIEDTTYKYNILFGKKYFNRKNINYKLKIKKKNNLWHIPPKYFSDNTYKEKNFICY